MADLELKSLPAPEEHPLLDQPDSERLRQEVEALKKQLEEERNKNKEKHDPKPPNHKTLWIIAAIIVGFLLIGFFVGYLPSHRREKKLKEEAQAEAKALPMVTFVKAQASAAVAHLLLPGNMEALTEAPILARSNGYLKKRYVDIGDRVKKGQLLAEVDAPDLDQQVAQARSQLSQAEAAEKQAGANLEQGKANQALSHITAIRWAALLKRGAVSRQENDQYQAQDQAQIANVNSLTQAQQAARQNVGSARANLDRLIELQGYEYLRSPFDGIVTLRNVDLGALITTGSTLLFRVAQIDRLRIFVYTPQTEAPNVQVGQHAAVHVNEFPNRDFDGVITRSSKSLDPQSRTLLTEVQIPNTDGTLLPGMYGLVKMNSQRADRPILVPGSALIVRADGTFIAILEDAGDNQNKNLDTTLPQNASGTKVGGKNQDKKGTDKNQDKNGKRSGGKNTADKKDGKKSDKAKSESKTAKEEKQKQERFEEQKLPEFIVHLVPVAVGRDYGNEIEIVSGLQGGERVVQAPNDDVQDKARVHGSLANPEGSTTGGSKQDSNTEQFSNQPEGDKAPKNSDKEIKTRGPGY